MASTISVGVNSYVTLDAADDYMADRLHSSAWSGASDADKTAALLQSARILGRFEYVGRPSDPNDLLAFPRVGLKDAAGRAVDRDTVPTAVESAQVELAFALLGEDLEASDRDRGMTRLAVDSIEMEWAPGVSGSRCPAVVRDLLRPFLRSVGSTSVRVTR